MHWSFPGYHSRVVIYTVLGAGMGVSASSCLSFCFNAFSSVSIWLSSLPAVITVLRGIDNASRVKISEAFSKQKDGKGTGKVEG
jgi:hypothetical protein